VNLKKKLFIFNVPYISVYPLFFCACAGRWLSNRTAICSVL